jgi:DNA-binding transcriptional MerR regulator
MKIGDLSAQSGTPVETIRFYEREGLLPKPSRTISNYRIYEGPHVERLAVKSRVIISPVEAGRCSEPGM